MKRLFFGAQIWAFPVILALFACLYGYLMKPDVAGFLYDDGMYLMAAKSLATGHGYRLGEIFGQPLFYKYPPLYPVVLAGLMLATPAFPANIVWLKLANIALGITTLGLLYYYAKACLRLPVWLAIGIVAAMGTNWRFIEASTELMSEPVFMALSMLLLVLSHRFMEERQSLSHRQLLMLVLLSAAIFYGRTMGLVLVIAVCLWIYGRGFPKKAFLYASGCGILTMPWLLWCATKPDTTYPIGHFLVRTFQETYFQSFRSDLHYEANLLEIYSNGVRELLGNFSVQFFPLLERFFLSKATLLSEGTILLSSFAIALCLGCRAYRCAKSGQLSLGGIYVSLYLLVLPFWSFYKFYPRFIMVILPLMWLIGVQAIRESQLSSKAKTVSLGSLLALSVLTNTLHLIPFLQKPYANTLIINSSKDLWQDYTGVLNFISHHTPENAVLYTDIGDENYFYGLNTGRTTLDFFIFLPKAVMNQSCPQASISCLNQWFAYRAEATYRVLRQRGANYGILNRFALIKNQYNNWSLAKRAMPIIPLMIQQHPQAFQPVFESPDGWITVYRILPEASP